MGMKIIACGSPYGKGGIGRHFAQIVEEAREKGHLQHYYTPIIKPDDGQYGTRIPLREFDWIRHYTPVRFSQSWLSVAKGEIFDRKVASKLNEPAGVLVGFVGKTLHSFEKAKRLGFGKLELIATNSHVNNLMRLHKRAGRETGIHDSWLNEVQRRKTIKEYELADVIRVHSEYVRQTFIEEGVPEQKLERMYLTVHPRFKPPDGRPDDGVFRVVYVGRVEATKGIPLLIEAFSRLSVSPAELILVGGWSTRAMRRYMEERMSRDPRIRLAPGDPLPILHQADVFVHPSYEDGFAYAPFEALACGVPVIVTEDTGMKEYVEEGVNGFIVPTGNWKAIHERLEYVARHPISQSFTLTNAS
jgi:glycosyltransferase involved in cell wall biosynthesis